MRFSPPLLKRLGALSAAAWLAAAGCLWFLAPALPLRRGGEFAPLELRRAREALGRPSSRFADRLGVSQAYWALLGKRQAGSHRFRLAERVTVLLTLPPTGLPVGHHAVSAARSPSLVGPQRYALCGSRDQRAVGWGPPSRIASGCPTRAGSRAADTEWWPTGNPVEEGAARR